MPKRILQQRNKRNIYKNNNECYSFCTTTFVFLIPEHPFISARNPKGCPLESFSTLETRI